MTENEKDTARALRLQGQSYAQIGARLGLPANTVKSCCRRGSANGAVCKNCGKPLADAAGRPNKRFCCDCCRIDWWKQNRDRLDKKAVYHLRCAYCGRDFDSYGNRDRKYCGHPCYIAHRFGRVEGVP